ncbi:MAG: hypothetical protein ACE5HT_09490 [Gemmatimonadales bacterium]
MHTPILPGAVKLARCLTLLAVAGPLAAQGDAPPPPAYLQVFREVIKTGRTGPHVETEAGWPRAFAKAKTQNHYLALESVFGRSEVWFIEGHESIAEIDQINKDLDAVPGLSQTLDKLSQADAANVASLRTILARFRPGLSNPGQVDVAQMRVWEIIVFRVRPGREADFAESAQLYRSVVEQANVAAPWATYEIMAGMPGPTYLVLVPHRGLAEIDPATGAGAAIEKAMSGVMAKRLGTLAEGFYSVENIVFNVSPEMSYPSPEMIAADPQFWGRKRR